MAGPCINYVLLGTAVWTTVCMHLDICIGWHRHRHLTSWDYNTPMSAFFKWTAISFTPWLTDRAYCSVCTWMVFVKLLSYFNYSSCTISAGLSTPLTNGETQSGADFCFNRALLFSSPSRNEQHESDISYVLSSPSLEPHPAAILH